MILWKLTTRWRFVACGCRPSGRTAAPSGGAGTWMPVLSFVIITIIITINSSPLSSSSSIHHYKHQFIRWSFLANYDHLCSLCRLSRALRLFRSRSSKFWRNWIRFGFSYQNCPGDHHHQFIMMIMVIITLMKCLALLSSPSVVCRELSLPTGTWEY